jgi:CheY-like chemotaxis protein
MDHVEHVCVFVRAAGERLLAAERLVLAFPGLLEGALRECELHHRAATGFLGVVIRLDAAALTPAASDRLAFWAARAGGRATPLGGLAPGEREKIRVHLEFCELAQRSIAPGALFDASGRFFSAAGAPAGRRRSHADRPVLAMELGGPGWEGARYAEEGKLLFVAAPIAPPIGDAVPLAIRLPGADRPSLGSATVVGVRETAVAPGLPAGYTLRIETAPPALLEALARAARSQDEPALQGAPRPHGHGAPKEVPAPAPPHAAPLEEATDPELAAERPRRALVVDDDALVRQMLADALVGRGFETLTAGDASEGLRTLSEELLDLDLLLTDVRMPGMDGEGLVRLIRKAGGETDLAIVVVTGRLEDGLEPKLEAAGADAVLDKALGPELIAQAADAVLERRRLVAQDG